MLPLRPETETATGAPRPVAGPRGPRYPLGQASLRLLVQPLEVAAVTARLAAVVVRVGRVMGDGAVPQIGLARFRQIALAGRPP